VFSAIRTRQLQLKYTRIDLFILAGLVWIGVSLALADYKYATIIEGIKILSYVALWLLSRLIVSSQATQTILLFTIIGSGYLQLCVAFYKKFILNAAGWQSGFVNPNEFACFLVIGMHIALGFLLFRQPISGNHNRQAAIKPKPVLILFMVVFVGISGYMLVALQSRGALVSCAVVIFVLMTLRHKYAGLVFIVILCVASIIPLPQGSLVQRLSKRDDPFAYQRLDIWQSSARMFADHPVAGVGLGMYPHYGAEYNFPVEHRIARYGKQLNLAHSDLLHLGAELGVVGLLLALCVLASLGTVSLRLLQNRPRSWHVVAASMALFGVLLHGLVSNLLLSPAIAMTSVLLARILVESAGADTQKTWKIPDRKEIIASWYAALVLGAAYILIPGIGYPFLGHWHFLKYQEQRNAGQLPEAVRHLQKAIRYVPMQAHYHHAFGQLYAAAFRNQPNLDAYYEGYKSLAEALRHNPREPQFYMTMADLHRNMFRQKLPTRPTAENAIKEYKRALEVDPFNPFIRLEMATLYAEIGAFDQAIGLMQEAVGYEPNFVGGHQLLGEFLRHLERDAEAAEAFARAEQIRQTYPNYDHWPEYTQSLLRPLKQQATE
jgi:O-antigen ligase